MVKRQKENITLKQHFELNCVNEKSAICMMDMAEKNEFSYAEFVRFWFKQWPDDLEIESRNSTHAFAEVNRCNGYISQPYLGKYMKSLFVATIKKYGDSLSYEQAVDIRNSTRLQGNSEEFEKLNEIAKAKGMYVTKGTNISELSGYKVSIRSNSNHKAIAGRYFELSYQKAVEFISKAKPLEKVESLEKLLLDTICTGTKGEKYNRAKTYKCEYSTPDFDQKIVKTLGRKDLTYGIIMEIVNICIRYRLKDNQGKYIRLRKSKSYRSCSK